MAIDLTDKVLVITGASSGIGAETAVAATKRGMRIVLAARRADRLEQVAERVRTAGGEVLAVPTDVTDDQQVRALMDRAVERFGRLDVLFANAGFGHFERMTDPTPGVERRMWEVNYFGCLQTVRAAAAVMKERGGGHIIVTSSIAGRSGLPYYGSYAASKAAQYAMVNSLMLELEPDGIRVSGLYPVGTKTEFFASAAGEGGREALSENTPDFMLQTPEHVAKRIVRCLRRPRPEIWPARLGHFGVVLWTAFPRFYRFCFRFHAKDCRKVLNRPTDEPVAK